LKATSEDTPIDEREDIFNKIDKLEKEVLDIYEKALNEVMPVAFSIVKDTARRFAENETVEVTATDFDRELAADPSKDFVTIEGDKAIYHTEWTAGGNKLKWEIEGIELPPNVNAPEGEGYVRFALVLPEAKIKEMIRAVDDSGILR
jgi:preprotein translocase subunit SecA